MSEKKLSQLPHIELPVDEHTTLRQVQASQAEELFDLVDRNRDYLAKWLPWVDDTRNPADSRYFIEKMLDHRQSGTEYGYGIYHEGALVGHISLMHINDGKDPEIGYWVAEGISGRGIASRSAEVLTDFGLKSLGLDHIVIKADPKNLASNKVAENIGYKLHSQAEDERTGSIVNVWRVNAKIS